MMKKNRSLVVWVGFLALFSFNSYGLGPVDGGIGVSWWGTDFEADFSDAEIDAGSKFVYGEGWLGDKWGIRGAWYDSDLEGELLSNQTRINLELRRKLFSASDNNFLALGAGLESLDLSNGSGAEGLRLSAEGRFGVPGPFLFYGRYALAPDMGDAGSFGDISSSELDLGIHITTHWPFAV
jgi:hypothetical protein